MCSFRVRQELSFSFLWNSLGVEAEALFEFRVSELNSVVRGDAKIGAIRKNLENIVRICLTKNQKYFFFTLNFLNIRFSGIPFYETLE